MSLDVKAVALAGAVVIAPTLLGLGGVGRRFAGAANLAAASSLRASELALDVPASARMLDAYDTFARTFDAEPSLLELLRAQAVWLDAYRAGAAAQPFDYSLQGVSSSGDDPRNAVPYTELDWVCGGSVDVGGIPAESPGLGELNQLGRAMCALYSLKLAHLDDGERRAALLAAVRAAAVAMDAADFVPSGARRSDGSAYGGSVAEVPGKLAGAVAGFLGDAAWGFVSSPAGLVLVGGAAFVAWKVLR